jgi:hypothetical protein
MKQITPTPTWSEADYSLQYVALLLATQNSLSSQTSLLSDYVKQTITTTRTTTSTTRDCYLTTLSWKPGELIDVSLIKSMDEVQLNLILSLYVEQHGGKGAREVVSSVIAASSFIIVLIRDDHSTRGHRPKCLACGNIIEHGILYSEFGRKKAHVVCVKWLKMQ